MPDPRRDPVLPADDAARTLACGLMTEARHAALAVIEAGAGTPYVSRIAFGLGPDGAPVTLISALAPHFAALRETPECALLIGEPGPRGDPLTHPRLTLRARSAHDTLRAHYLATHPKAALYADFADFSFVRFAVRSGAINGGFGRAYALTPADLAG